MSSSGALACGFAASRLAAPRRLAAALAAAAPSEDIHRLPSRSLKRAHHDAFSCARRRELRRWGVSFASLRHSTQSRCAVRLRGQAELRSARYRALEHERVFCASPRDRKSRVPRWEGGRGCPLRGRPQPVRPQGRTVQRAAQRRSSRREPPKGTSSTD